VILPTNSTANTASATLANKLTSKVTLGMLYSFKLICYFEIRMR
jgi:hypothetical protein